MYSGETIRQISREAGARAAAENMVPFVVEQEDVDDWKAKLERSELPSFPFPHLGDHRPDGWELEDRLFVDKYGVGREDEPALTIRQLVDKLEPGKGYAILESGQFQIYIGVFVKE